MTKEEFKKTGMFTCREDFEKKVVANPPLHTDCTDVLVYNGGFYIECLKTNRFLLQVIDNDKEFVFSHHRLDDVEQILWELFADKSINKKNRN